MLTFVAVMALTIVVGIVLYREDDRRRARFLASLPRVTRR